MMSASDKDKKQELALLTDERHAMERELAAVKERMSHSKAEQERLESELEEARDSLEETKSRQNWWKTT